jgi:hypothetical protein
VLEGVNVTHPVSGMAGVGSKAPSLVPPVDGACAQDDAGPSPGDGAGAGVIAADRVQLAAEHLLAALHALGAAESAADAEETLAGVIVGTRAAIDFSVEHDQLLTAAMWLALHELADAVRQHLTPGLTTGGVAS